MLKEWTRLPLITPKQLKVSKSVNVLLSGDLEANIDCYPFFEGKEKHFLKTVCVRIAHGSYVVPKGMYKANDENRKF